MPITDYDGQLQTIANNLGESPALTNTDGLLEAIAKGTENIITEDKLDDYLPLAGGTMAGAIVGNPLTLSADDGNDSADLVLNPSGSATWNGKEVERVNASGSNYIRYESGLQVCWGTCAGSGDATGEPVTFGAAFKEAPAITCTATYQTSTASYHVSIQMRSISATGFNCITSINTSFTTASCRYIAIGKWK